MTNRSLPVVVVVAIICLCFTTSTKKGELARLQYIKQYTYLAQKQMHLHQIPASKVMAQAILESCDGSSPLALIANNHFGMKCKTGWSGKTYMKKDDDRNAQGKIIHSCFKVYTNAEESYEDYGNYLSSKPWYASLFELPITDYKSWAYGLKKAGYATSKDYAQKLISIIEKNRLYTLDTTRGESFEQTEQGQNQNYTGTTQHFDTTNWDKPIQLLMSYTNEGKENSAVMPGSPPPSHNLMIRMLHFSGRKPEIRK